MRRPLPRIVRLWLWSFAAALLATILAGAAGFDRVAAGAGITVGALILLGLGLVLLRVLRWFLWRVGRRLAFSYFLIGILPIPMVALLALLAATMAGGFFLGHLYRDAVHGLHSELSTLAAAHLQGAPASLQAPSGLKASFSSYRNGRKVSGGQEFPTQWPAWMTVGPLPAFDPGSAKEVLPNFVTRADGAISLAAAAGGAERGVIVLLEGDLASQISERADVWVGLLLPEDVGSSDTVRLQIGSREFALRPPGSQRPGETSRQFFERRTRTPGSWLDRPAVVWGEMSGPLVALADGSPVANRVVATLNGSPRQVHRHLFSASAEVNTTAWAAVIAVSFLLFDVYLVALLMAGTMIFSLSRAVDRLSNATAAIARADFSVRIPVRRKDQLGALQRSFNSMGEHLTELVATAAQKEALENELSVARTLQQSLLPNAGSGGPTRGTPLLTPRLEFATSFEPSAAIGGDYYDILPAAGGRQAVIIADVSGHGLPAGLRMAMLKAALQLLVEDGRSAAAVLARLDRVVRGGEGARSFVTATLAYVDPATGEVELLNAGHPPTYRCRNDGTVEEFCLPGSALGGLGTSHGRARLHLEPGETLVWLSDGLIEAANERDEPFGYDRIVRTLERVDPANDPHAIRDHLLSEVRRHTAGRPADDDRTLVVMRYRAPGDSDTDAV